MKPVVVLILLIFASLLSVPLRAANFVTVKAWASEEYLKERARNPKKKVQTYQVFKGKQYTGKSADKGIGEFRFEDIIADLVPHLAKQDYYPNPVLGEGDLLLVIHYGVTDYEEDQLELMGIESMGDISNANLGNIEIGSVEAFDLSDSLNSALGMQSAINAGNQMTWEEKAQILGIDDQYDKPDFLTSDYEYEQMMREARYFVVVMAYDYQLFRKKGTRKLLWSTRYNIRTSGQSFETAIKEMNEIGSSYFGKNFEKLMRKRQDDDSKVEIGDIEVLKTEEERE